MKKSVFTWIAVLMLGSTTSMAQRHVGNGEMARGGSHQVAQNVGSRRGGYQDDMYAAPRGGYVRGHRDGVRNERRVIENHGPRVIHHAPRMVVHPAPVPPPPPCAPVPPPPPPVRHHHTVHVSPEGVVVGAIVGTVIGALLSH